MFGFSSNQAMSFASNQPEYEFEPQDTLDLPQHIAQDARTARTYYRDPSPEPTSAGNPTNKGDSPLAKQRRVIEQQVDDDHGLNLRRKRVSDMTPEERLRWSRFARYILSPFSFDVVGVQDAISGPF